MMWALRYGPMPRSGEVTLCAWTAPFCRNTRGGEVDAVVAGRVEAPAAVEAQPVADAVEEGGDPVAVAGGEDQALRGERERPVLFPLVEAEGVGAGVLVVRGFGECRVADEPGRDGAAALFS